MFTQSKVTKVQNTTNATCPKNSWVWDLRRHDVTRKGKSRCIVRSTTTSLSKPKTSYNQKSKLYELGLRVVDSVLDRASSTSHLKNIIYSSLVLQDIKTLLHVFPFLSFFLNKTELFLHLGKNNTSLKPFVVWDGPPFQQKVLRSPTNSQ